MKRHVKSLQKSSEADQCVVHNLMGSGVYLRITLSTTLLHKLWTLMLLTATGPEVFVTNMNTFLYDSYDALEETITHMKSLKFKDHPDRNTADCYDAILVNVESLESAGSFKPEHLDYIICIFEDISNSRFHIWATHKYKEVLEFIKKPLLCDKDVMHTNDFITYGLLDQEYLREYNNIVNSKQVHFKSRRSGNGSSSGRG